MRSGQSTRVQGNADRPGAEKVADWIRRFEERADSGPFETPHCHHFGAPSSGSTGPHVVLGVITHGNEFGTLPGILRLQEELMAGTVRPTFPVTLLLGNVEAARAHVRFLEEDFNRVMTFDRPADNLERRRAEEVRPVLEAADFFLDIHQTQTPTLSPFWTLPWEGELGTWARALGGASTGLTRAPGGTFSQGKCCLDEFVRARGAVGITIEVGERGEDAVQATRTYGVMRRALEVQERLLQGDSLSELAQEMPPIEWYETRDVVPAVSSEHRLRPGVFNFTSVSKGELLSPPEGPEIRASATGRILFPKYPAPGAPPPPELFRLGVPVEDPAKLYSGN